MRNNMTNKSNSKMLMIASVLVITAGAVMFVVDAAAQSLVTDYSWLLFAAMALLAAPIDAVFNSRLNANVRFGLVCSFICAGLFGPSAGVVVAVINASITEFRRAKTYNSLFYNVAVSVISISEASLATSKMFPEFGSQTSEMSTVNVAVAMGVFTLFYFSLSTLLTAVYSALSGGQSFFAILISRFQATSLCYVVTGASAITACLLAELAGNTVLLALTFILMAALFFIQAFVRRINNSAKGASLSNMLNPVARV